MLEQIAHELVLLGRATEALAHLEQGIEIYLGVLEPARRGGKKMSRGHNMVLADTLRRLFGSYQQAGDLAGCRAAAERYERLPSIMGRRIAIVCYDRARYRASCSSLYAAANNPAEAAADADQAMAWLTKAVAEGFNHRARMEKNQDLDALRGRPDFQRLFASLPEPKEVAPPPPEKK
jgi:hypothetical protein